MMPAMRITILIKTNIQNIEGRSQICHRNRVMTPVTEKSDATHGKSNSSLQGKNLDPDKYWLGV